MPDSKEKIDGDMYVELLRQIGLIGNNLLVIIEDIIDSEILEEKSETPREEKLTLLLKTVAGTAFFMNSKVMDLWEAIFKDVSYVNKKDTADAVPPKEFNIKDCDKN